MTIEKKRYWLRHLILIIVIAVVLFPMVWLISTSVRRDQAAFSPNLFSTRVTLQHYKNLLFPERSVQRLILDIQEATYKLGRFRDKSEKSINNTVEKYLNKFEALMSESKQIASDLGTSFASADEVLGADIDKKMILALNRLREEDLKLIDEKLEELKNAEDDNVKSAAALEILSSLKPSTNGEFIFFLDDVKLDDALKLKSFLRDFDKMRIGILNAATNLSSLLDDLDFEMKSEVLESLSRTSEYISTNGAEYSQWRKNEYYKFIRKYISRLEKDLPEDLSGKIKNEREGLYNSFKAAKTSWDEIETLFKQLKDELKTAKTKALGTDYTDYSAAIEELSDVENEISQKEKFIEQSLAGRAELRESMSVAIPILVPESGRLRSLKSVIEKALEGPNIKPTETEKSEELSDFYKRLESIIADFKQLGYKDDIYAALLNIESDLGWFVERAGILTANTNNSEIKKALEILEASRINLLRVIPDIEKVVGDARSLETGIATAQNELNELKKRKVLLEQKIAELTNSYNKLLEKYNANVEIIKLEYAHTIVAENITDITAAETYAEKAGEIVSECFGYKYNKRYRDFTWYKDFKEAQDNITEGTSVLSEAISELSVHEALLKEKIYDYIHLRFLGTPVTLDEFTLMITNYNKYFQVFNAKYQRASRKISDLLDYPSSYSSQYNPQLKKIDRLLFRNNQIWMPKESTYFYFTKWIMNSIIVALMVALISVTVAALAAYPFSRMRFFGRSQGLLFLLLIQMFPSIMFMIAIYALLQFMGNYIPFLGLNSLSGLIFVYSGGIAFNIWLIKGYFDTIPDTLEESAMIDGATRFQTFWRIVLPLARPILAVIAILTFMGIFNEFVMARIFLQDINKWTYAVGLQQFSGRFETSWGPFTAAALIGAIPMITFFLILQDYIVGGLTKGAVKG
ncbi:MAG: ABC transporter permease subunit [Kosmotoga sp.]|uniref:ABC transporter permease subunit n=1 Tax=Kosmotoga sp. TaxID=1955248 RepID=UPI0025BDAE56|nr:ABC transporter permease subunit [Kosmotoga sp.]MCD6159262.1 ABC transporter permease subunit [Kosmotoga sp.]